MEGLGQQLSAPKIDYMAFDNYQADRIKQVFSEKKVHFTLKKMMGGLIFMVNDKMCIGLDIDKKTNQDRLMVRVGPDVYEEALSLKGAGDMDFTGRKMKGFVFVKAEGWDFEDDLNRWIDLALAYNPLAPKSKSRRNKKIDN